ncbi:MAG: hypothetical protein ACI4RI_00990 [Ruminococcus sp.]
MNRKQILARQQELLDLAKRENRSLTDEEKKEFDTLTGQLRALAPNSSESENNAENGGATPKKPTTEERQAIVTAERSRINTITEMCRNFDIPDTMMRSLIDDGASEDEARTQVMDHLQKSRQPLPSGVEVTESAEDKFRRAAVDGILQRGKIPVAKPAAGSNNFRGMSLRNLAVECLSRDGEGEVRDLMRMSSDDIFNKLMRSYYNPTSSFPAIMDQAINKSYLEMYNHTKTTFEKITSKGILTDFKKADNYWVSGPVGELLEVPENGELKADTISDKERPQRQLKTYGRQFSMSRQAFINDDIGVLTSIPGKYAVSGKKTINKQVYSILVNNPDIYDGEKLFCSKHGNLVSKGTGVTMESVCAMATAMGTQVDDFGDSIIINPSIIVVPVGYSFDMYTLFFSPTISTAGNTQAVNPLYQYRESITVVEDSTINALCGGSGKVTPWFLFADLNDCPGIEVAYLNGQEVPTIRRSEKPGTLGFVWDVYHDWAVSLMDYRGIFKNPGIALNTKL